MAADYAAETPDLYDFIIVGGGSAGCAAANRLITRHGASVLVLEAGGHKRSFLASIPAGTVKMWKGQTDYVGRYVSEPQPGLDGRRVPLEHGRVLGGGSTINMMAYMRGSRQDYARWSEAVGGGWGWDDLLPYFRAQEGNERFENDIHGGDGPLKVSNPTHRSELSHRFVKALQTLGLPYSADLTNGTLDGVGYAQCTIGNAKRCSAVEAFIDPIRHDHRLRLITRATVSRVLVEGAVATGVEYQTAEGSKRAMARGEILVSAGTYATPKLLMLSGIGDGAQLREHGLTVVRELPGVGTNLQDHHYAVLSARAAPNVGFHGHDRGLQMLMNGLRYLAFKDGPASASGSESMAFLRFEPSDAEAGFQIYCMALMHPVVPADCQGPGLSLLVNLLAPRARGKVRLRSSDPVDDPAIDLGWLEHEDDRAAMLAAVRRARAVFDQPAFASVLKGEVWPGEAAQTDDDLLAHIRRTLVSNHHPVGTCRMGRAEDPASVVDGQLRVHGVERLRVLDASMMPILPRAATNATVMAVAARGVDLMMARGP